MRRLALLVLALLGLTLLIPGTVLAADVAPQPDGPVAVGVNLWLIVIGVGIRGVMYLINHNAPFLKTEPQKQVAVALAGAIGGALYQVLFSGTLGANDETLNAVLQATVFTLGAHELLFKPGGINLKLGGGSNRTG